MNRSLLDAFRRMMAGCFYWARLAGVCLLRVCPAPSRRRPRDRPQQADARTRRRGAYGRRLQGGRLWLFERGHFRRPRQDHPLLVAGYGRAPANAPSAGRHRPDGVSDVALAVARWTSAGRGDISCADPDYDHRIHLISLPEGKIVKSLKGHSHAIYDVAFSPDGKRLASASHDATVRIWDVASGTTAQTLRGHTGPAHAVAWNIDGQTIASASLDKTARIWSAESGKELAVLREHTASVMTVCLEPRWADHRHRLRRQAPASL